MSNTKEIKLPTLKPEDAWIDKLEHANEVSEEIKQLLYLPTIAYKTAVYAYEKKLSHNQKDYLVLLFHKEISKAFGIIYEQVQITVGNSSSDRIGYLKDFESWQERLVELLKKSLGCISEEALSDELEALIPENEPLFYNNRHEWEKRLKRHCQKKVQVFNYLEYDQKFVDFTREILKLFRRFSSMFSITMERSEWMLRAMKNFGIQVPIEPKPASGNARDKNRRPPLSENAAAVYELLKSLPEHKAMTGTQIINAIYEQNKNILIDQSTLTKNIMPILKKHYGVKNIRRTGYFIAK